MLKWRRVESSRFSQIALIKPLICSSIVNARDHNRLLSSFEPIFHDWVHKFTDFFDKNRFLFFDRKPMHGTLHVFQTINLIGGKSHHF